jgi:hypothetical protein
LQEGLTAYLDSLGRIRRTARGKRVRPSRPSTIRTRRAELLAFVRQAVAIGIPLESLSSLGALLHPDVVEPVLEVYWQKNGPEPANYTIDLAWKLQAIARETGCLGTTRTRSCASTISGPSSTAIADRASRTRT